MSKILVNAALPYANGPIHLGHVAGAYLNSDIFVRFMRMLGHEVMFISGSDEHGTPATLAADRQHISPMDIADRFHKEHVDAFNGLDIIFDIYTRTTYPEHSETVAEFFTDFYNKGLLSEHTMVAPFCPKDNRFMPDRYIEGKCPNCGFEDARGDQCDNCGKLLDPQELISPRCVLCGTTPEFRETRHMFFHLDNFQDSLLEWLEDKDYWRHSVLAFTRNFIRSGLRERPITRDIEWGVPVPLEGYEHKRIYVWFEALLGYISGARVLSEELGKKDYWREFYFDPGVKMYHFMGKDNIIFHTIIWPAMLMGRGEYNLPYLVTANEFLTFNGKQFSKSRGIGYSVDEILKLASKDYVRYYLTSILPEGSDADFSLEEFQSRVNGELIDKFGNYIHRMTSFIVNNNLEISSSKARPDDLDREALEFAQERIRNYNSYMEKVEQKKAMGEWLELVKYANSYFNNAQPWRLVKTDVDQCISKLYHSLVLAQYCTTMLYPFVPSASEAMMERIGAAKFSERKFTADLLTMDGSEFRPVKGEPPFTKLSLIKENPNFADLRIGEIREAREHPNADRLYVLKVNLGASDIQLVAGLRKHYGPDELIGRKIIVIANLKPTKLRGEVSQGMLLAADDGENVSLLSPLGEGLEPGDAVKIGGYGFNNSGKIDLDRLKTLEMRMEDTGGRSIATATLDGKREEINAGGARVTTHRSVKDGAQIR